MINRILQIVCDANFNGHNCGSKLEFQIEMSPMRAMNRYGWTYVPFGRSTAQHFCPVCAKKDYVKRIILDADIAVSQRAAG